MEGQEIKLEFNGMQLDQKKLVQDYPFNPLQINSIKVMYEFLILLITDLNS